ncbi:hypothetical protein Mal4_48730 [Maioricimonas rarisocia]|uniref:Neutral/alkaline non-lysosomal ceramidase n=1 Tax=Maioricimonas rarisocia TaxID=2528026 RepID=A0A517ZDH2_9PLAN|nr:hypothetical protein [Maioricimonas rarisocia]QDU40515.1 hypothetical protein Mal4_48730 [Maioricimonas rarisocia]
MTRRLLPILLLVAICRPAPGDEYRLATFSADVTIPLGHRCMGILPTKAQRIESPLEARGFVLLGPGKPIVLLAFDWCEIRNDSYDEWRRACAKAAGTDAERVLVSSLHQHDAPVVDSGAQKLLDAVGLQTELFDPAFHDECVRRVTAALTESLEQARPVTHLGLGQARVQKVASNRRVELPDGRVNYSRGSNSGGNAAFAAADDGLIDPNLKTISFWNGDEPLLALHAYATHPMSYYGRGGVSWDFVGIARDRRQRDQLDVLQIYVSGCSGDVTAGKYNDGSPAMRPLLADRLYQAMTKAWEQTERVPLERITVRRTELDLPFHEGDEFRREAMEKVLHNEEVDVRQRILAAMGLASLDRIEQGRGIDVPCVDFGPAQILLLPGESFVGYQLDAQKLRPDSFVMTIGYGECWPGYIPTQAAFDEHFGHSWRWVGPDAPKAMRTALEQVLLPTANDQ